LPGQETLHVKRAFVRAPGRGVEFHLVADFIRLHDPGADRAGDSESPAAPHAGGRRIGHPSGADGFLRLPLQRSFCHRLTPGDRILRSWETRRQRRADGLPVAEVAGQTFLTNADFRPIAPMPSMRQSMSWSPSTRRMFFTLVPTFTTEEDPLTFRSLITVTVSPSCSSLPTASRTTRACGSAGAAAAIGHSCAHSGQM